MLGSAVITTDAVGISIVAKPFHGEQFIILVRAAALVRVLHHAGLPAVSHQGGYCIHLGGGIVVVVEINHVVPVNVYCWQSGQTEVCRQRGVGWESRQFLGVFPVIHHLGHRRGHTSGVTVFAIHHRALAVIGCALSPVASDHRLDSDIIGRGGGRLDVGMGPQAFHLPLVLIQQPLHVGRDVFHVDVAVTIGQHRTGAVITADDNKTLLVLDIEHVVIGLLGILGGKLGMRQLHHRIGCRQALSRLRINELLSSKLSHISINGSCARAGCSHHGSRNH